MSWFLMLIVSILKIMVGYEFAKQFYADAYEMAVNEVGGEQYILSAVMHADERHRPLSEKLGKDIFHYHLHVVYVPVVQKEIKWSKRCKDKNLVGNVKEVITQVSHSKKWNSQKYKYENGKTKLINAYSKLQDRYYIHMKRCGYNIERGEKGSVDEHMTVAEFKLHQEQQRLENLQKDIETEENNLTEKIQASEIAVANREYEEQAIIEIKDKKAKLKDVNTVSVKNAMFDNSKIVVDKNDFDNIKTLAKQHLVVENEVDKWKQASSRWYNKANTLQEDFDVMKAELDEYKSVKNQLDIAKIQAENHNLKQIIEKNGLSLNNLKKLSQNR